MRTREVAVRCCDPDCDGTVDVVVSGSLRDPGGAQLDEYEAECAHEQDQDALLDRAVEAIIDRERP